MQVKPLPTQEVGLKYHEQLMQFKSYDSRLTCSIDLIYLPNLPDYESWMTSHACSRWSGLHMWRWNKAHRGLRMPTQRKLPKRPSKTMQNVVVLIGFAIISPKGYVSISYIQKWACCQQEEDFQVPVSSKFEQPLKFERHWAAAATALHV